MQNVFERLIIIFRYMLESLKSLLLPLKVLKKEKFFVFWPIYTLFCAIITLISDLLNNNLVNSGFLFAYSIGILCPMIFSFLTDALMSKKAGTSTKFVSIKAVYLIISIMLTISSIIAYCTEVIKDNKLCQIIFFIISTFVAFLYYLSNIMNYFEDYVELYDDIPYLVNENKRQKEIENKSKHINKNEIGGLKI